MAKGLIITDVYADGRSAVGEHLTYVFGDLEKQNKPYLDEDGNPLATVTCQPITSEKKKQVAKKHTTRIADKAGRMVEEIDSMGFAEELIKFCVIDWTGLIDKNGDVIPCNDQTKLKALNFDRRADVLGFCTRNEQLMTEDEQVQSFRQSA